MKKLFILAAVLTATAGVSTAATLSATFETNEAASFTATVASSTIDANANFLYDAGTFSQTNAAGTVPVIPAAPSGAATKNVLRLNANVADDTDTDAVSIFPNVTLSSHYIMTFDAWGNYNGGAGGGSGSTQSIMIGGAASSAVAPRQAAVTGGAAYFTMTVEGGNATTDYRFYNGSTSPVVNNAAATWLPSGPPTVLNNGDAAFTAYFPSPTFETAGAPGKAWVTFQLEVNGTAMTLRAKKPGDSGFSVLATGTAVAASDVAAPFVGFTDQNATRPVTDPAWVSDQFVLIDNYNVADAAAVGDWNMY